MAGQSKLDLILHPVRLRILMALAGNDMTTQELARRVGDTPASSIYRHVNRLVAAGLIEVVAERPVRGTVEKTLRATTSASIGPAEAEAMSVDDLQRGLVAFLTLLMHEWEVYLRQPGMNLGADMAGYRLASLYASDDEWVHALTQLNAIFLPLLEDGPGRRRRWIASLTWPAIEQLATDQE